MQPPRPDAQGEQTFEMLWDCRFCGTTKLLGLKDRHCPNCGASQDPAWRYFPSDADMKFVENPKFGGADLICSACQEANSADAKFCRQCGADLSSAKQAERVDTLTTGLEGATSAAPDVVLKKFQAEQQAIAAKATRPRRKILGLPTALVALLAVILVAGGVIFFLATSRVSTSLTVTDLQWKRTLAVESYTAHSEGDWQGSVPSGAYNQSCYRKQSGSHQVYDHTENVCRNESVQVQCGYTYSDNGNGSGSRKPKYCSQQQRVCTNEKIYRDVPDYSTWCDYKVNRWDHEKDLVSSGGLNDPPAWPNFSPALTGSTLGAERAGTQTEVYTVIFKDASGKQYHYDLTSLDKWSAFKLEQRYNVQFNRLGDAFWDTLKPGG